MAPIELRRPLAQRLRLLAAWTIPTALLVGLVAYSRTGGTGLKVVAWGAICTLLITLLADLLGWVFGSVPLQKYLVATAVRLGLGGWAMIFLAIRTAPLASTEIIGYLTPFYLCLLVTDVHAALEALKLKRPV